MRLSNLLLIFTLALGACASNQPSEVNVSTEHVNTCPHPPVAGAVVMREVEFVIIQDKHGIYWIGLSPKGYENLSQNTADILMHIKQKNAVIKFYEDCLNGNENK